MAGASVAERLKRLAIRRLRRDPGAPVERSNRAARVIVDRIDSESGVGPEWADRRYGDYYLTSAAVHAAVRVRAEAVARPPVTVMIRSKLGASAGLVEGRGSTGRGRAEWAPAGADDLLQALLDRPNPVWTGGALWRATETYLLLWGSAYWGIERGQRRRCDRAVASQAGPGAGAARFEAVHQGFCL